MNFTREFYIPEQAIKVADKNSDAVAYVYDRPAENGKVLVFAMVFAGKARKPVWHHRFLTASDRAKRIARFFESRQARKAAAAANRAQRKAEERGVEVGDVLRSSWGYEQTNIDYYEVTKLIGKTMVEVRKIASGSVQGEWMQGECTPLPGEYIGDPIRKVCRGGRVRISSCQSASKIEPTVVAGVKTYGTDRWTAYH